MRVCTRLTGLFLVGVGVLAPEAAQAEFRFQDGMWRFELAAGPAFHSGNRSRTGDFQVVGEVEYEIPATDHATLGLRLLPLFVYSQDDEGEDTVWGAGVGIAARYYQIPEEYRGWYGEVEGALLGHSGRIDGNSGNFNFMIGAGVGYQFANDWHTALKFRHISNAGLSDENSGANTINLGVGCRF